MYLPVGTYLSVLNETFEAQSTPQKWLRCPNSPIEATIKLTYAKARRHGSGSIV